MPVDLLEGLGQAGDHTPLGRVAGEAGGGAAVDRRGAGEGGDRAGVLAGVGRNARRRRRGGVGGQRSPPGKGPFRSFLRTMR